MKQMPTFMRYAKVQAVLEKEPAFRKILGPKDQPVCKPNGTPQGFSREVIAVTESIHASNMDAQSLTNHQIIDTAIGVLLSGKPLKKRLTIKAEAVAAKPVKAKAVKAAKKIKAKAVKAKAVKAKAAARKTPKAVQADPVPMPVPMPAPVPEAASAPVSESEPQAAAPEPGPAPPAAPAVPPEVLPPKSESATGKRSSPPVVDERRTESKPLAGTQRVVIDGQRVMVDNFPFIVAVPVVTMFHAIETLVDHYDKAPGYEDRKQRISALSDEYMTLNYISKGAKEVSAASAR